MKKKKVMIQRIDDGLEVYMYIRFASIRKMKKDGDIYIYVIRWKTFGETKSYLGLVESFLGFCCCHDDNEAGALLVLPFFRNFRRCSGKKKKGKNLNILF